MNSTLKSLKARRLAVSLALSVAILAIGIRFSEGLAFQHTTKGLLWPIGRLLLLIGMGLTVGQIVEAVGWTKNLAVLARPLFRFSRLGPRCSAAFTMAFFSGEAANAMLVDFYKEDKISKKQLFLSNWINQVPAYFLHLPTTFFIVIPLTRWAGGLYFLLTFIALMLRTALFLIYGHLQTGWSLTDPSGVGSEPGTRGERAAGKAWTAVKKKLPGRFVRIAVYVLPIYTGVYVLNDLGFFEAARAFLSETVTHRAVPMESVSLVIVGFVAEFTSGFAAAGALMDAGALTIKETVLALLAGNILAFPVRALRHQLPRYMGIFSPKMGLQLLLTGQGFRILSLILVGLAYWSIG